MEDSGHVGWRPVENWRSNEGAAGYSRDMSREEVAPRIPPMEGWRRRRSHEAEAATRLSSLSPPDTSLRLDQLASKLLFVSEGPTTSTPRQECVSPGKSLLMMADPSFRSAARHHDISKDEGVHSPREDFNSSESGDDSNPRFKTEICRNFKEKGCCLYGNDCQFAHGTNEMRDTGKHNKYKTKLCQKYWIAGYCAYGPRCNFLHNEDDNTKGRKASGGETSGDSLDWTPSPSSLSPARVPPLSSLTRPPYGSGRMGVYQDQEQTIWVDTWTHRVV